MEWIILPTDVLLWVLCIMLGYTVIQLRRSFLKDEILIGFQTSKIFRITWFIFIGYLSIAFLDSVHIRLDSPAAFVGHFPQNPSLLDWILRPLLLVDETTYSAPLALQSWQSQMSLDDQGIWHLKNQKLNIVPDQFETLGSVLKYSLLLLAEILLSIHLLGWLMRWIGTLFRPLKILRLWSWQWCTVMGILITLVLLSTKIHILGTNQVGQDIFYLCLKSIRTSLVLAGSSLLLTTPLGVGLGMMAGYFRGWIDDFIQYLYVTINSVPGVLLIAVGILSIQMYWTTHSLALSTMVKSDLRLLMLCLILGLTSWTGLCRLVRAECMKLRELEFIAAARVLGRSHLGIFWKHLLPNVLPLVLMTVVLDLSGLILAESVLSYVGVGVDPTLPSFGNMINSARLELARQPAVWWPLMSAFIFMFGLVFSLNILAERLRQILLPAR